MVHGVVRTLSLAALFSATIALGCASRDYDGRRGYDDDRYDRYGPYYGTPIPYPAPYGHSGHEGSLERHQEREQRALEREQADEDRALRQQQRDQKKELKQDDQWSQDDKQRQRDERKDLDHQQQDERRDLKRHQKQERQDYWD